ncbi:imidazolonepropionase-like amidohydrolase [Sphingomonas kyeonggiensis]|uniref:amidohydrolase family protein n=1 Tax=Sphingomonas kyeonggiensis TaxID=1268553 RepID=UPI00278160A3|nr:amidohydrolase family protein [Sphingomonas kyeonggiensis]MDQ0252041.1 imidazolonepropionase-like amidohydrolase [Sphingomonas kyeonggiensis]
MAVAAMAGAGSAEAQERATLIHGARVFDGTGKPAKIADVLIEDGKVARVGRKLRVPEGTEVIDATGMTLIPGLHDLHIHTRREAFTDAASLHRFYLPYLRAGVTSVNEFSVSGAMMAGIRALQADTPRLTLAVRLGVPDGHGTESQFTNSITIQVTTPAEAHAAMAGALVYRPDMVKVFNDGWRYGDPDRPDRPSMDEPTLAAIVADAHKAGIKVLTHTVTLEGAKIAARAGVDSVAHGVGDALVDDELIRLMKKHHMAYVATLATYEPLEARVLAPEELALLTPEQQARETARQAKGEAIAPYDSRRWSIMRDNIRRLKAARIRIGVGTDTGIEGVYPGFGALREMRILTELGFTPAEAIEAGTKVSAGIMGRKDEGVIRKGARADLVLTGGAPDVTFRDLYAVKRVWVAGREVSLD